jgi:hypothetical protein
LDAELLNLLLELRVPGSQFAAGLMLENQQCRDGRCEERRQSEF